MAAAAGSEGAEMRGRDRGSGKRERAGTNCCDLSPEREDDQPGKSSGSESHVTIEDQGAGHPAGCGEGRAGTTGDTGAVNGHRASQAKACALGLVSQGTAVVTAAEVTQLAWSTSHRGRWV